MPLRKSAGLSRLCFVCQIGFLILAIPAAAQAESNDPRAIMAVFLCIFAAITMAILQSMFDPVEPS